MDSGGRIRFPLTTEYCLPLQINTNIVYVTEEEIFPHLESDLHKREPTLTISPEYKTVHTSTVFTEPVDDLTPQQSLSRYDTHDDLYSLLDDMEFSPEHLSEESYKFLQSVLDFDAEVFQSDYNAPALIHCLDPEQEHDICDLVKPVSSLDNPGPFYREESPITRKRSPCKRPLSNIYDETEVSVMSCKKVKLSNNPTFDSSAMFPNMDFAMNKNSTMSPPDVFSHCFCKSSPSRIRQC